MTITANELIENCELDILPMLSADNFKERNERHSIAKLLCDLDKMPTMTWWVNGTSTELNVYFGDMLAFLDIFGEKEVESWDIVHDKEQGISFINFKLENIIIFC